MSTDSEFQYRELIRVSNELSTRLKKTPVNREDNTPNGMNDIYRVRIGYALNKLFNFFRQKESPVYRPRYDELEGVRDEIVQNPKKKGRF